MNDSTELRGPIRRITAVLAALAVIASLAIAAPAVALPTTEPSDPREPTITETSLEAARIPTGEGVEPVAVASQFQAGYLISDYAFFNRYAMSEAEIQAFLEARGGVCQNTRCISILRQTSISRAATERCNAYTGGTDEPISRIIYKVQVACGISAKVLLVTLQKEQSLVTSTAPTERAVNYALGFGCPDTAPCDPTFAGIAVQLYYAAAQFQRYRLNPLSYNFRPGTFDILYHPNAACGRKTVTIVNQATAGLYNYTPYTPNAAALANLYGTGDGCSTYGNRNFWRLYTDWFGSPTTLVPSGVATARLAGSDRWATAAQISSDTYPSGAATVYIAVGTSFPDGLAAAPAAALAGAPLLLVATDSIPGATSAELQRLNPTTIRIVGGTGVVSPTVEEGLRQLVPAATITRYAGSDRYGTAAAIAEQAFAGGATTVFLATGDGFADALSASAAAGSFAAPVLLVRPGATELPPETRALIESLGATRVIIAGGVGVVSPDVESSAATIPGVTEVRRFGGADRYATAALINAFAFPAADSGYIASGRDFPDALAAAAAAGAVGAPLYLSNGTCTYTPSLQHLVDIGVGRVAFAGGTGVLRSTVTEFMTCG